VKHSAGRERVEKWFAGKGLEPFEFQRAAWEAYLAGKHGLIKAPTGTGKTLAAAMGVVIEYFDGHLQKERKRGLTMLWITPLRALAADTVKSLSEAFNELGLNWSVELRTSDTSASLRKKQREKLPTVLVTTPESLSVLLSYPDSPDRFDELRMIVVDEWHELMGSKRGVQTELGVARLRGIKPSLRVWGIGATLSNIEQACAALVGPADAGAAEIVRGPESKPISLASVLPPTVERFPWAGHLGLRMTEATAQQIESAGTTLVFTNTRSQTELWFRALLEIRPQWIGKIAVHHGSIDRKIRGRIEQMLRDGTLLCVVCTSSLDLGVDFWPVDQVIQIGSPKSIARTIQRAGRSGHRPGAESRIVCVPTQAIEIVEFSAARHAIAHRQIEPREPVTMALDVLAQHLVTIAAGSGFDEQPMQREVRSTNAFARMTDENWRWVMDFVQRGGPSLTAYPRFARIRQDESGKWVTASESLARMHRMNIGTIAADGAVVVQFVGGKRLGAVEESFAAKLKAGDVFTFAGRSLEFVRMHEMTAQVRTAKKKKSMVPRWMGGRLPMSSSLAEAMRLRLHQAAEGNYEDEEMQRVRSVLELQGRWSRIPRLGEVVIENTTMRGNHHEYLFFFQGRLVHEGIAAVVSYRLARRGISPVTATFNDYGIELMSPMAMAPDQITWRELLTTENLIEDVLACVNGSELARRHFREIAHIAGLLNPARPGAKRGVRQLQASSALFYDVFTEFDPANLLLDQARREVLAQQLEFARLQSALEHLGQQEIVLVHTQRLSPLAFPLWAEGIGTQQLRYEKNIDRIERLARQLEEAAAKENLSATAGQV
jgi:ATP-dependent Lhr-like helicase